MPAFQPVPETVQVAWFMRATGGAKDLINTMAFKLDAAGVTQGDVDAIAEAASVAWESQLQGRCPNEYELYQCSARDLSSEFGVSAVFEDVVVGTAEFNTMALNSALVTTFNCEGGSAPRRGRIFWPFVPENAVDQYGVVDGTTRGIMDDAWSAIADVVSDAGFPNGDHVVISRYHQVANPSPPPATISALRTEGLTNNVVSYVTREYVGSQRDRRANI